jgi:hypothetical protein
MGQYFREVLPQDTLVAFAGAGAFGYYSELPLVDTLGLTDEQIARHGHRWEGTLQGHAAYDLEYVRNRRPVVWILRATGVDAPYFPRPSGYIPVEFQHLKGDLGGILYVRADSVDKITNLLSRDSDVSFIPYLSRWFGTSFRFGVQIV